MNYIIHRDDELMHFGVRGQKWGVRRYQNEDGSYKSGAEGRYDPDGTPGPNTGHTLKNRAKAALGIYKPGDDNPYVSEKRKIKRTEEYLDYEKRKKKKAEKDAEKTKQEEEKAKQKAEKAKEKAEKAKKKAREEQEAEEWLEDMRQKYEASQAEKAAKKQAKEDEKNEKNSYKKIAGKYLLRNIGTGVVSNIAGNAVTKLTGNELAGLYTNAGLQTAAGLHNLVKSGKEAKSLYDYRKRKSAQHSDLTEYDALYHSASGQTFGIIRS